MTKSIAEELGVVPIINAGGPNTKHSGSRPRPETLEAMREVSSSFVQMEEMLIAAGEEIARLLGVEAATVTSGASGGLVVQAAAAIARDDPELIARLPMADGIPNELIIQRRQRFVYDHLYLGAGARLVEVGNSEGCDLDELIGAISEKTAGIIHLESPFKNRGAVPLPDLVEAAHERGLPVLCDAASMLPPRANLTKFVNQGADLVSFSGGKEFRAPKARASCSGMRHGLNTPGSTTPHTPPRPGVRRFRERRSPGYWRRCAHLLTKTKKRRRRTTNGRWSLSSTWWPRFRA